MTRQIVLGVLSTQRVTGHLRGHHRDSHIWKPTSLIPRVSLRPVPHRWVQVLQGHRIPYHTLPKQYRLHSQHHPFHHPLHKGRTNHQCFLLPYQADPTGMRCLGPSTFNRWHQIPSTILPTVQVPHQPSQVCLDWVNRALPGLVLLHPTDQGTNYLTHLLISSPSAQWVTSRVPRAL